VVEDTQPELLEGAAELATLDAGLARERARSALFGESEVEHKIDRFTILDHIGTGAMGIVYAAYDPNLDRKIAVKLVRAPKSAEAEHVQERMVAEARAMAKVSHPNVISVYEVGVTQTPPPSVFVAMEFIEGQTLRDWLAREKPHWRRIVAVFARAGKGLAAVH
jgi:serine/threonine protein kinase